MFSLLLQSFAVFLLDLVFSPKKTNLSFRAVFQRLLPKKQGSFSRQVQNHHKIKSPLDILWKKIWGQNAYPRWLDLKPITFVLLGTYGILDFYWYCFRWKTNLGLVCLFQGNLGYFWPIREIFHKIKVNSNFSVGNRQIHFPPFWKWQV